MSEPLGPPALPLAGHLPAFLADKLGFLSRAAAEYGAVVPLQIGRRACLLSDPDDIGHVLVSNADNYGKSRRLTSRRRKRFFGSGLVTAEGADHRRHRRILQPLFHRETIARFSRVILESADDMLGGWKDGACCDLHAEMLALTQRIMVRVLLGDSCGEAVRFAEAVSVRRRYQEYLLGSVFPFPELLPTAMTRMHHRADRELDAILDHAIRLRRATTSGPPDLLSLLVRAKFDDGTGMSDRQVRDEARTFTLAGYETLAEALTWTWYLLAGFPPAAAEVHAEVARVAGARGLDAIDWRLFRYSRMVLAEAMRLYPPTWVFVRVAREDDVLPCGVRVRAGTTVYLSPWVMHRHPRYFADPDVFDPRRFDDAAVQARPRFVYFPFGGGRRLCIGEEFAWMEGVLLLASIARRFAFLLVDGHRVEPDPNVTLRPEAGLMVRMVRR